MATCAIVSFRLGGTDGVSVVAASWSRALADMGFDVVTVAGEGPVDRTVAGLALGAAAPPPVGEVEDALADADVVVVENLLTIPMNLPASRVVAGVLAGRPAILHHHDPPWQRVHYAHVDELPPDDPAWRHVTINDLTRHELAARDITATTIYNGFDLDLEVRDRTEARAGLGVGDDELLFVHPVRAIPRKGIEHALELCERLDATYWLTGPAEDGYDEELAAVLDRARLAGVRVVRGQRPYADVYGAPDAVLFPSSWEGFGNPPVEAAIHGLPAVVGPYPVADELRALGFDWLGVGDVDGLRRRLAEPADVRAERAERDRELVARHLSLEVMADRLRSLLDEAGWTP